MKEWGHDLFIANVDLVEAFDSVVEGLCGSITLATTILVLVFSQSIRQLDGRGCVQ